MTVKITILGLGQIGASIGLALAGHKDQVTTVGHDKSPQVTREAARVGVVEKVDMNLPSSVMGADIILLAMPLDQIHETLRYISLDVRAEAVIMDTAPAKVKVAGWIREILPPDRHYIGLTPALNPAVLDESARGLQAARADLFAKGLVGISAPPGTPSEALKLATAFVSLLGSEPFFVDPEEADGLMSAAHFLPALAAAALAESVRGQPGWSDIRKLAGKSLAGALHPFEMEETAALAAMADHNRENSLRVIDEYIATLESIRSDIAAGEQKSLHKRLEEAARAMEQWRSERHQGDWKTVEFGRQELPKTSDILKQQVGGLDKLFGGRRKKKTDAE